MTDYNSRIADKFVIRLRDGMREKISNIARGKHRSMNSQILAYLELCINLEEQGIPVTGEAIMATNEHNVLLRAFEEAGSPDTQIVSLEQPRFRPQIGQPVWITERKRHGMVNDLLIEHDLQGNEWLSVVVELRHGTGAAYELNFPVAELEESRL